MIETYLAWLKANGVMAEPEIATGDGLQILGYKPPTYIVWRNALGSQLKQGAALIAGRGDYRDALFEVQSFLNMVPGELVSFAAFTAPKVPAPQQAQPHPVIGMLFEGDGSVGSLFYVNASGVQEGSTYALDGLRFVCIAPNPFDRKWKRIA